jgi:hypothetical protein
MGASSLLVLLAVILPNVFSLSPPPLPCEEQEYYSQLVVECNQNPDYPAAWVQTNSDVYNCEGYCERLTMPPPPLPPCDEQDYGSYYESKQECTQNSGIWITTDSDPFNCQGNCEYPTTTSPPPTTSLYSCNFQLEHLRYTCETSEEKPGKWIWINQDPANCQGYCKYLPCNEQMYTDYWYNKMQCGENPNHPGVWVDTNLDPANCQGYCNYTILTTTTPPTPSPPTPSATRRRLKIKHMPMDMLQVE